MSTNYFKEKSKMKKWVKYFIFNVMLFVAFFAMQGNGGEVLKAAEAAVTSPSYVIHQSNHHGNNSGESTNAFDVKTEQANDDGSNTTINKNTTYHSNWYVQGTGVHMQDVITLTLTVPYHQINGIIAFETNYTGSNNRNYDAYIKESDASGNYVWDTAGRTAAGYTRVGKVLDSTACNTFETTAAANLTTELNKADEDERVYSYLCISEVKDVKIEIKYAYTIRNAGYGDKHIMFVLYNDDAYDPTSGVVNGQATAYDYDINFVVAKPIDENEFTWVNGTTGKTECGTNVSATGRPTTSNICVDYVNGTTSNVAKELKVTLPKETAYYHNVAIERDATKNNAIIINSIKDNTIFAKNTFKNDPTEDNNVIYYYYDFNLTNNSNMNTSDAYIITISIDASGNYIFTIKDIFGNVYTSTEDVGVKDVLKTNIIVDYTNEQNLTIMDVTTSAYASSDWRKEWQFVINEGLIDFKKIVADEVTIEVHLFHKVVISNGVFGGNGTDGAETGSNVEDIAKQPLGYKDGGTAGNNPNQFGDDSIVIWRVDKVSDDEDGDTAFGSDTDNHVSCGTDTNKLCSSDDLSLGNVDTYTNDGRKNKITFTVRSNGRYRIKVTDNFNNTTNSLTGDNKNPSVEVSVIDRSVPVVGYENNNTEDGVLNKDAFTNTIYSHDYVIGGGKINPVIPESLSGDYWKTAASYSTIYYNSKGSKLFDYEDALKIANIKVLDPVYAYKANDIDNYFANYNVNFGYAASTCSNVAAGTTGGTIAAGIYCDPSASAKSDRNASGTAYNLHSYIISNNLMSFSAGLVIQANQATYESTTYSAITGTAPSDYIVSEGNANSGVGLGNAFAGYLSIKFKNSSDALICTVEIDSAKAEGSLTNQKCFSLMNQYIDDVENFSMTFQTRDYVYDSANSKDSVMHESNEYVVNVKIVDDTAPGIDKTTENPIEYTNENSVCRLEIDNEIQLKAALLECYKIKSGQTYYIKDNNINHAASGVSLAAGEQFYNLAEGDENYGTFFYHNKIVISVLEEGTWGTIGDTGGSNPVLKKSGYHQFKIEIYDHWDDVHGQTGVESNADYKDDNLLTIYVTYYVNPRTLLIEPLAKDKMYGESEPVFDYCVYVNNDEYTFHLQDNFFDVNFIHRYFTAIYCTRDVYVPITDSNRYSATEVSASPYNYYSFSQNNNGAYLKVNNTYVKIEDVKKYNMSYVEHANGEFVKKDESFYEIKSGYVYTDDTCLYAVTDGTVEGKYLKTSAGCLKIIGSGEGNNRYTEKYTQANNGIYLKYNNSNTISADGYDNVSTNANTALVNNNEFNGKLARVESRCYNTFPNNYYSNFDVDGYSGYANCDENSTASGKAVRNDNVGQYNIVLGTLAIKEGSGTRYNEDYVIKLNTNYVAGTFALGGEQTITKKEPDGNVLVDDGLKTESTVLFTIRQAVLTIRADGSSKRYAEQDPYSHNWNNNATSINTGIAGYLGGYTVSGWRYNGNEMDSENYKRSGSETLYSIILGALRRDVGENVGIYNICNISSNPSQMNLSNCQADVGSLGFYNSSQIYYFEAYDHYLVGGAVSDASGAVLPALTINTNGEIYGTGTGRTLNTGTRNYAIVFIKNNFEIKATDLIIQPGINQGKEYAESEYKDPLWNLVVYGENVALNASTNEWESIIKAGAADSFSGYTETITLAKNPVSAQRGVDPYDGDSEVYYARRKTSPDTTYQYIKYIDIGSGIQKYVKTGNFYYESTTGVVSPGTTDLYVFAYGKYYQITDEYRCVSANGSSSSSGNYLKIVIDGRLVNQEDYLFSDDFVLERETGKAVGWYSYVALNNYKLNSDNTTVKYYTIRSNGRTQCNISIDGVTVNLVNSVGCRNYNVVYAKNAPTSMMSGQTITGYQTEEGTTPIYKPNGVDECTSATAYSSPCGDGNKAEITFEIFKREIILEFIDDNYTLIYGERYDYYDGGTYNASVHQYNTNTNGIFYINDATSERNIFLCYSDLGEYLADCTENPDYGLTAGHKWTDIGLEFHLHSIVSAEDSGYYKTGTDKALPAGEYYVYASISASASLNYKFTYRGGTLKIQPKVTNVQLTGYTMEYGESQYESYGVGSNYSEYTSYKNVLCMNNLSYKRDDEGNIKEGLITDCSETGNVVGNTYGFVIEGLDAKDTIADNFNGRPVRASNNVSNVGEFDDVGYYKIGVGNIANIQDKNIKVANFKECPTNVDVNGVVNTTDCVFVKDSMAASNGEYATGINAKNYDITYSLANNEGSYLFITPATVDITVYENQTKMYGCAYVDYKTDPTYYSTYSYDNGYTNCYVSGTDTKFDLAYRYTVTGDKDVGSTPYDVGTSTADGSRVFYEKGTNTPIARSKSILTNDRLYRVSYSSTISYKTAKESYEKYQGQAVGVYTISLGKLDIVGNSNALMCDNYNNPVLDGGKPCRNYNINYYGESTTVEKEDHTYSDKDKEVNVENLSLYVLNYIATDNVSEAQYVYINGKYVALKSLNRYKNNGTSYEVDVDGEYVLVENFARIDSLKSVRFNKQTEYVKSSTCGADCYIYSNGYKLLSNVTKYKFYDGSYVEDANGTHLKVIKGTKENYIQITSFVTFAKGNIYVQNDAGNYVFVNNEYVQLSSLNKYKYDATTKLYSKDASGSYVQIYEYKKLADLAKFKLDANAKFKLVEGATDEDTNRDNNVFVFVNGSYIPYHAFVGSNTKVTVNSAKTTTTVSGVTTNAEVRGTTATDVIFTITARIVYVHPEYNIKPYGDVDPLEYITCKEIKAAYMGDHTAGRESYCANFNDYVPKDNTKQGAHIDLGVTMYYAVQNSLAKAPWTEWTDYVDPTTNNQTRSAYNDIQFDVLTGKVSRRFDSTNTADINDGAKTDRAGKYTFDFGNVTTTNKADGLTGDNYLIQYVTKNYSGGTGILTGDQAYSDTYVKLTTGGYEKLSTLLFEECDYSDPHCIADTSEKGKTIKNNSFTLKVNANGEVYADGSSGTSTSISLIPKYYHNASSYINIDYWYLGFYKNDDGEGRNGELAVWWSDEDRLSSDTSKNLFNTPYDTFKSKNHSVKATENNGGTTYSYFHSESREVYFEIVRRTIYLYAVDVEKIYGEADKYSDFLVAICSNADGYVKDADGNVTCKSGQADYARGLSDTDKAKFINADGVMNQWKIKNKGVSTNSEYIFQGATDLYESFGIYFRRTEGENAGSYTLTACAVQSDVKDCTHKPATLSPNYTIEFLGDNYTIVEVPGVLTIKTRVVDITPDAGQGFMYGNYMENGTMPNITFKENHDHDNNSSTDKVAGLVYGSSGVYLFDQTNTQVAQITSVLDGSNNVTSLYKFTIENGANAGTYTIDGEYVINNSTNTKVSTISVVEANGQNTKTIKIGSITYTIVQKARCLISISGLSTICISDGQNEALANSLGEGYYDYGVTYQQSLETKVCDGVCASDDDTDWKVIEDITKVYYSYNVYGDTYANPKNVNTRSEADARSALNMKCGEVENLRYSRDVCSYDITKGDLAISSGVTTTRTVYVYVTKARRFTRSGSEGSYVYTQSDSGTFVKYGEGLYAEYDETKLKAYVCDDDGMNCRYETLTEEKSKYNNKYLPVEVSASNYAIGEFDATKKFEISKAAIEVTPDERQNKIYGEADIEIKFTVVVSYIVTRTHYQQFANSNIIKICNASTCYTGNDLNGYKYNYSSGVYTQNNGGSYILLTKGWTVTLDSFAYDEENENNSANHLDYGVNFAAQKHTTSTTEVEQTNTSIVHYDKYTTYNNTIDTERILVGNLYVAELNDDDTIKTAHIQTVGEKPIVNGMKVATNNLGNVNYDLRFVSKQFVIVPRPVNVNIENITKTYGQATDSVSCDGGYATPCVVGDGILNGQENGTLLVNNYNILQKDVVSAIGSSNYSTGVELKTTTYADTGVTVVYMSSSTDYSKMNMPTVKSGTVATNYTGYVSATANSYYTASGTEEKKNDTLNIQVERKVETSAADDGTNIARDKAECMFNGEENGCEDVGEYYLYFNVRGGEDNAKTKESTVVNAYYNEYWGYNPNYYVIVYNNFEASGWSGSESYTSISADTTLHTYRDSNVLPGESATLKIRKRPIEIVVETISEYTYTQNNTGTHLRMGSEGSYVYHKITDTNTYILDGTVYKQSKMTDSSKTYYLCTYAQSNTNTNCKEITAANRYNITSTSVGEKYSIEQNMDVPELLGVSNDKGVHHTSYENITWYEHPLQVRTGDNLFGKVAYCSNTYTLTDSYKLDDIRSISGCPSGETLHYYDANINKENTSNFFSTMDNGAYIITREANVLYIRSNENTGGNYKINDGTYEANNYTTTFVNGVLQIDLDETPPVINIETDFIIKEANEKNMSQGTAGSVLAFLDALITNGCAGLTSTRNIDEANKTNTPNTCDNIVFTYENGSNKDETEAGKKPSVGYSSMETLLKWFGLSSFDPGIIRADAEVQNKDRYHARWYMAIQADFNQKKTGNYTIFIYAQDDVGNISLASTVTLRVVDTTKPTVGTLNLYSAKVKCDNGLDCTNEDNWTVAEDIYLPINALSTYNISNMKADDKLHKYMYTTNGSGQYVYVQNDNFGTYYKITTGTSAKAVKHDGWINSSTGIYMTVTGGDDNSLTYLNIKDYTKYSISGDTITVNNSTGTDILLGSFINVDNLTKYREVILKNCTILAGANCENTDANASGTKVYMPDKTGTIIRYKGYYFDLSTGNYIGTAPTGEYVLNLYSYKSGVYTKATSIPTTRPADTTYYIRDGEMYTLPSERYNVDRKHGTGAEYTYINFAQWDHYYSRDGGNTWALFDRDAQSGYLALGEDGQRLIMIKAVDTGFTYNGTDVSKDHITDAYCKDVGGKTCNEWWGVDVGKITIKNGETPIAYKEYIGSKVLGYNVSDWAGYNEGSQNQDAKYAYLDTIFPRIELTDDFTDIFEYGCENSTTCSNVYDEKFGIGIDGYVFELAKLNKYSSTGGVGSTHVRINGKLIEITNAIRYNLDPTTKALTRADNGDYIYLGVNDTVLSSVSNQFLNGGSASITGSLEVYDKNSCSGEPVSCKVTVTLGTVGDVTAENRTNLASNTKQIQSGVGQGNNTMFDGVGNTNQTFGVTSSQIDDKYVQIYVYADVRGGVSGAPVIGHPHLNAQGYYKFVIRYEDSSYNVYSCYNNGSSYGEQSWCSPTSTAVSYGTMKDAIDAIVKVYKAKEDGSGENAYNFNGNDIIFTMDYRVFDLAGNASYYERKLLMLYSFTRTIAANNGGGAAAASLSVEVPQNANVMDMLSNFSIVTTTGKNLRTEERILQSVYYNGVLVSSRAAYDLQALQTLDTTVPGNYRIVYTIERKDGSTYAVGNSVELNIMVVPDVANVDLSTINYGYLVAALCGIITLGCVGLFLNKKKKIG